MKKSLLSISFVFAFVLFGYGQTYVTIAEDDAGNYGGSWTNGNNQGSGFNPWVLTSNGGSGGFAGHFIGDPSAAGISGMSANSFATFSNPDVAGNEAKARRFFTAGEMLIGDVFTYQMGMNFDGGNSNAFKGIDLLNSSGAVVLNFNMGSSATITYSAPGTSNSGNLFTAYGTNAMNFTITKVNATDYQIEVTPRTGSTNFNQTFDLSGDIAGFEIYSGRLNSGDQRQVYLNNFKLDRPSYTTIGSGDFTNTAIWDDGIVPNGNGNINIDHNVNLNTDLSLNGNLEISTGNTLTVNSGQVLTNNGSINIDGDLVFESTSTSTAQYGNSSGTITGDVTVERFIPAKRAFRVLSSAVGGQSIANAWQQDTHITGAGGATNGFDATNLNTPSLFTFDNSTDPQTNGAGWQAVTSTSTNIVAGTPYRLFVRGDRTIDLTDNADAPTVTTLSAKGIMHTGNFSPTLATVANNYSFVGNPYQAVVDINATTRTNLTNFIYVWDASIAGDNGNGGFVTVPIPGSATPNPFSSDATQYIAPGQAFFVQNTASGNGSITFEEADKATAQTQQTPFSINNEFYINSRLYKSSAFNNGEMESDAIGLRFGESYTTLGSDEDAGKLGNPAENYVINNNGLKALDFQNIPTHGHVVELALVNYEDNDYHLTFDLDHKPENLKAYLNDTYLETKTEITSGLSYNFTVDASISESVNTFRFNISFEEVSLSSIDFETNNFRVHPNPVEDVLHIQFNTALSNTTEISFFNLIGKKVNSFKFNATQNVMSLPVDNLSSGVYLIQLQSGELNLTKKFIKK